MGKVDLHVHSKYSNHPSEWFLQRLGASESYTEPEAIYRLIAYDFSQHKSTPFTGLSGWMSCCSL